MDMAEGMSLLNCELAVVSISISQNAFPTVQGNCFQGLDVARTLLAIRLRVKRCFIDCGSSKGKKEGRMLCACVV